MKIRKAIAKDAIKLKELYDEFRENQLALFRGQKISKLQSQWEKEKSVSQIKHLIKSKNRIIFIAEHDTKFVGFVSGEIKKASVLEGDILDLYVRNEYRNKKIASKLVKGILPWFKKRQCGWASLYVYSKNKPAKKFYQKAGFKTMVEILKRKI